jgi:hypothetical protein
MPSQSARLCCHVRLRTLIIEELDFDGFRFDYVKGFGAWMIALLAKYQYQKKDGREFTPFVVGEYWSGPGDIEGWLDRVREVTDQQMAAFDFPLRYKLKDVCDSPGYSLMNLTDGGSVVASRPFNAVTFVENHDMGGNEIINDKMMAYSFILTGDGYPCVFWWDYFNCELARPGTPHGIDALIAAHSQYAGGESVVLHVDPDLYIMQRSGAENQSGSDLRAEQPRQPMERDFSQDPLGQPEVQAGRVGRARRGLSGRAHHRWRWQRGVSSTTAGILRLRARLVAASAPVRDGNMQEGKQSTERTGEAFQPLHAALVRFDAELQLAQAARLSVAEQLLHLHL